MKYDFHNKNFSDITVNPHKLAVSGSDSDIDWLSLKTKVEYLSGALHKLHIPQGHPVIIYGHKEYTFAVAILACIHASVTYVPIDIIYPVERIKKIVDITQAQVIINCSGKKVDINFAIEIDSEFKLKINHTSTFPENIEHFAEDPLQYIMFTSGSTGEPKGVQITKNSTLKFIDWASKDFGFNETDVFMNQAPFTFDVSLCDLFNAFALGGSLILNSNEIVKDQDAFIARLKKYHCSIWTSTPSFAFLFLRHSELNSENIPSLRTFLFMGEELPLRTCTQLKSKFPNAEIMNAYGPTEATIVTTLVKINQGIINKYHSIPIGYPMPESELLILKDNDEQKEGELVICGDHVSIGYYKNKDFNQSKFYIHNGKRAFKTGDLAYYKDGLLFFLGRNDNQVKLHGFRIELNEISNEICKNTAITDAITLPLKRNNEIKKLVTFVKIKERENFEQVKESLFSHLEKVLPYYMIPSDILIVEDFPYNTSHKIDNNKLIENYLKTLNS
jgi:D-alanine--poly(phosphoribitol) ligase subunit 1